MSQFTRSLACRVFGHRRVVAFGDRWHFDRDANRYYVILPPTGRLDLGDTTISLQWCDRCTTEKERREMETLRWNWGLEIMRNVFGVRS